LGSRAQSGRSQAVAAVMAMNESIYALIPQPVPEVQRAPRHVSKHSGDKAPTFSTFGLTGTSKPGYVNIAGGQSGTATGHHEYVKPFATMGKEGNAIHPSEFLRKGRGGGGGAADARGRELGGFVYTDRTRPSLPSKEELRQTKELLAATKKEPKNFVTSNAVENILAVPKREPQAVDWLKKPCFGEVPPYLTKIKQEINDEYEYIKSMQQQADMEGPPGMHVMPEEDRQELITSLKTKWDAVNKMYQQSSVLSLASLDTIGKVKRKEMYEAQLAQIEKDIEKLSKKTVYVTDD